MSAIKPKKLSLSTQTIRSLTPVELDSANGGLPWTVPIRWATRNLCPGLTIEAATRVLGCNGGDK